MKPHNNHRWLLLVKIEGNGLRLPNWSIACFYKSQRGDSEFRVKKADLDDILDWPVC